MRFGLSVGRDLGTRRLPVSQLANFIEHAPPESAITRAMNNYRASVEVMFLREIEHLLNLQLWAEADPKKRGPVPERVPLPGEEKKTSKRDTATVERKLIERAARRQAELASLGQETSSG